MSIGGATIVDSTGSGSTVVASDGAVSYAVTAIGCGAVGTGATSGSGTGRCAGVGDLRPDESFARPGGIVLPGRRGGGLALPAGRFGSWMPVGGALRVGPRRGGSGGKRRPHA
jgi:hypothetical protein